MRNEGTALDRFLSTDRNNLSLLIQRVVLGVVMFPHGAQKLLGWFGGFGFGGTMGFFTESMGIPSPIAFLVIIGESFGALALILGLGTRLAAFGIAAVMLGAVFMGHLEHGFFMNWFGAQKGEGYEYHLLALALAVPLMLRGGGMFAADLFLAERLQSGAPLPQASRS
ncbi:MAG: DoxX family protein [Rhodospirillales bacterium]|nr:DoxX family protein [Rhodospirillales bacterium]